MTYYQNALYHTLCGRTIFHLPNTFHDALNAAGIKHEFEVYAGTHFNRLFEKLATSLSFVSDVIVDKEKDYTNVFFMSLKQGLNMISLPLDPVTPYTAKSFAENISATMVVRYDELEGNFEGFVPIEPAGDGFSIEGGKGYIVNVTEDKVVPFVEHLNELRAEIIQLINKETNHFFPVSYHQESG